MRAELPKVVSPERLVRSGAPIGGAVKLEGMPRLAELLADSGDVRSVAQTSPDGVNEVRAELVFERNGAGRIRLRGTVEGEVALNCQRCLQPMVWVVKTSTELLVVDEEAGTAGIPDNEEVALAQDGHLDLWHLVEDELLLAAPAVPMHANRDCGVVEDALSAGLSGGSGSTNGLAVGHRDAPVEPSQLALESESENTRKPFADLAKLLKLNREQNQI